MAEASIATESLESAIGRQEREETRLIKILEIEKTTSVEEMIGLLIMSSIAGVAAEGEKQSKETANVLGGNPAGIVEPLLLRDSLMNRESPRTHTLRPIHPSLCRMREKRWL